MADFEINAPDEVSRHLGVLVALLTQRYRERMSAFFQRRASLPAFQHAIEHLSLPTRIEGEGTLHSAYGLSADWDRVLGAEFGLVVAGLDVTAEEAADLLAAALTADELYALLPDLEPARALDIFENLPEEVRRRLFEALVHTEDGRWVLDRWWDALDPDAQERLASVARSHGIVTAPFPQAYEAFEAYEERFLGRALAVIDNNDLAESLVGASPAFREKLLRHLPDRRRVDVQWDARQLEGQDEPPFRFEEARRRVLRAVAAELRRLTGK